MRGLRIPKIVAVILGSWLQVTTALARDSAQVGPVLGPAPRAPQSVAGLPGGGPRKHDVTQGMAFGVNGNSREQVRQFYNAVYAASEGVPMNSAAETANCIAGTNAAAFQLAELWRLNWFRAMSGLSANITFSTAESSEDQAAALMMSANNQLMHTGIPTSWICYSDSGATAADSSNLALGSDGPDAITGYIWDYGSGNTQVGHRRWLLYPQTQVMASGDVPAQGNNAAANATWTLDANYGSPRPATTYPFVAWPPPGYVPYQVVFPRWSFALSNADLNLAKVTMLSNGVPLDITIEPYLAGFGEDTCVWYPSALDPTSFSTAFPFNGADTVYSITISDVGTVDGYISFSYNVTNFDPSLPGADFVPTIVGGPNLASVNGNNTYSCTPSANPNATGYQWLSALSTNGNLSDHALGGLTNFTTSLSPGYSPITNPPAGGGKCFHLAHASPAPQWLQFTEILFPARNTSLSFQSLLGYATTNEVARVQVSTNEGLTWVDIFAQIGNNGSGQSGFAAHTLSLSNFANQITYLRFNYDYTGGAFSGPYYSNTTANVGWCIESIVLTNTSQLIDFSTSPTVSTNFNFVPIQAGNWVLEARGVIFGQFGLDWSPAVSVATPPYIATQPTNVTLLSGETAALSIAASGASAMTYQWQFNGANISGATSSTLTLQNSQPSEDGTYDVVVSNTYGTLTSATAVLSVIPQPSTSNGASLRITGAPQSETVPIGSAVFLSVSATGPAPLSYQWKHNGANLSDIGNYAGSTHATLVIAGAQAANPGSYTVVVSDGKTSVQSAAAILNVGAPVTVQVSGAGTVNPNYNGQVLLLGKPYTMTAEQKPGAMFAGWSGSINFAGTKLNFTVQSNLFLEASFVPNPYLAAQGNYYGLFAPTNVPRQQTNSGAFTLNITSTGIFSGKLTIGTNTPSLSGQFNAFGFASITTPRRGLSTWTTTMQLDFADQSVQGTVGDGSFTAVLDGNQQVFSASHPATSYEGAYTLILPGTTNPELGPFGDSYQTVSVLASGGISFSGSLADGTTVPLTTSAISKDGYWPFYLPLYGGNGSLWSWNYFSGGTIMATNASWINATNTLKTAVYRAGFTNPAATMIGSAYLSTIEPSLALTDGQVTLEGGNLLLPITNSFILTSKNALVLTNSGDTNKLTLTINKTSGVISGTFSNPSNPKATITLRGVLLQNQTNAQGYFLGSNQSGTFMLGQ